MVAGCRTSLDLEGALVGKAIENVMTLPQEVQEAVSMQKLQNNEITRCEKYLATILVCDELLIMTYQIQVVRPIKILKETKRKQILLYPYH